MFDRLQLARSTLPQLISDWGTYAPTPLVGLGSAFLLSSGGPAAAYFASAGLTLVILAFMLGHRAPSKRPLGLLSVMCALLIIGVPGALLWGMKAWILSLILAEWGLLMLVLYSIRIHSTVWAWLIVGALPHFAIALIQGVSHLADKGYRAVGLAENPGVAGGMADLAILYLAFKGKWYLIPPFITALYFTETRGAFWVLIGIMVLLAIRRVLKWHQLGAIALYFVLLGFAIWPSSQRLYDVAPIEIQSEIVHRLSPPNTTKPEPVTPSNSAPFESSGPEPTLLGFLPQGDPGNHNAHSAPMRLFYHTGMVGLGIWFWLTFDILSRSRQRFSLWVMLLLLGLSGLDYYTIMPPFSVVWWLALAVDDGNVVYTPLTSSKTG